MRAWTGRERLHERIMETTRRRSRAVNNEAPHTYRVTEIVGTSEESIQEAVRNGVARASRTLRNLDWFEVTEVRGWIRDGQVGHFQVGMKIGFRLEE
jgi:dodecin